MSDRLSTLACTTSIGPGATNMVTGAALATINRLPVLLLPGDIFSTRAASPLLQELEDPTLAGRVGQRRLPAGVALLRPHQPPGAARAGALAAMRVLTDPVETGAVTLALPQDVQAEAFDWPEEFFAERVWPVRRPVPEPERAGGGRGAPARRPAAADRVRRRDDLRGRDGDAARAGGADGRARRGDPGGQGLAPLRPSAGRRRDRRHRDDGRQRAGPRGRRRARHRHALERLHDRLAQHLRQPGRALRQPQRRAGGRVQARRPAADRGRAARAGGTRRRAGGLDGGSRAHRARPRARRRVGRDGRAGLHARARAAAGPVAR